VKKFLWIVLMSQMLSLVVLRGMEIFDNPPTAEIKVPYRSTPLHVPLYLLRLSKKYRGATGEIGTDLSKSKRQYTPDVVIGLFDFLKLFITPSGTQILPNQPEIDHFFAFHQPDKLDEFLDLLHYFDIEPLVLEYAHKSLVKIQFPPDEMVYIYPYDDLQFFTTIKEQLDAFQANDRRTDFFDPKQEPLLIDRIVHEKFNAVRQLLECCVVSGQVVQQLYYEQRKWVRAFFEKQPFSALHDFCGSLNYLVGPKLLLTLSCIEYAKRVKEMEVLDPLAEQITSDLVNGESYTSGMSHWFIDPVVQYIKGLIDIISIRELAKEGKSLSAFNDQLVEGWGIVYSPNGTMVSVWPHNMDRLFIDFSLGTVRQTGHKDRLLCDIFNHTGTVMASVTERIAPIILYTVTPSSLMVSPVTGLRSGALRCAFSADDTQLIVAGIDGWIVVYDMKHNKPIAEYNYGNNPIRSVDSHPHDNTMIAFAQKDRAYVVYPSFESSGETRVLLGNYKILDPGEDLEIITACAVTFTPDGERVIAVYELPEGQLCCVHYSAIDFTVQEKAFLAQPLEDITKISDVKIYTNAKRYVIIFGSNWAEAASCICVGTYGEQTFKELRTPAGLRERNYCISLCGDMLKYITCDSRSKNITYNSLHMRALQNDVEISMGGKALNVKPYWIFSAFTNDGTRLRVRTAQNKLSTLQLYTDDCIDFFDYCKIGQFSLKELHTLYRNYLAAARVKNISASDAFARLGQGMSDEFNREIKKCLPRKIALPYTVAEIPPYRGGSAEQQPQPISVQQEQGRMARWWAGMKNVRQQWGSQNVQRVVPATVPLGGANQPQVLPQQEVAEPEVEQPAVSGLVMRIIGRIGSIIMAPFRAVSWVAAGIWGLTLGRFF
jgi:WD40 repeat protein